jgi:hypothetical protein
MSHKKCGNINHRWRTTRYIRLGEASPISKEIGLFFVTNIRMFAGSVRNDSSLMAIFARVCGMMKIERRAYRRRIKQRYRGGIQLHPIFVHRRCPANPAGLFLSTRACDTQWTGKIAAGRLKTWQSRDHVSEPIAPLTIRGEPRNPDRQGSVGQRRAYEINTDEREESSWKYIRRSLI